MIRLSLKHIYLLHSQLIEETGGSAGVRDENLLASAIEAPFQIYDGWSCIQVFRQKPQDYVMALLRTMQ